MPLYSKLAATTMSVPMSVLFVLAFFSCALGNVLAGAAGPASLQFHNGGWGPAPRPQLDCGLCLTAVDAILSAYHGSGNNITVAVETALNICKRYRLDSDEVCAGLVHGEAAMFKYMADQVLDGSLPRKICGLSIHEGECVFHDEWTVDVDMGTKPAPIDPHVQEVETVTIVQVSDIHLERDYLAGSNAVCGEPVCCLQSQGSPANESQRAGAWGDYRGCDVPLRTMENTLQFIRQQHQKIDYIYMTGDLVDHSSWLVNQEFNTEVITEVTGALRRTFGNIPIIYAVGNHETVPSNCYAPIEVDSEGASIRWLYELLSELWSPYITDDAKQTVLKGGYYTLKVRDRFRVIVLNNNVCYTSNLWLAYKSEDPYGQLKWLAETLLQAEKNSEKVHLLYHIPSGYGQCVRTWSREFNKIVDRFENTIAAHFNGHTHSDEFHVYYSAGNVSRANGVALNGGSVTAFWDVNSNYKLYTVDARSWYVVDAESWIFNLTDANLHANSTPNWFKQYTFRDAYGVKSLIPSEMESLVNRMTKNHSLLQMYNSFYCKDGDPYLAEGCDDDCLKSRLCDIVTTDTSDSTHCNMMTAAFDAP